MRFTGKLSHDRRGAGSIVGAVFLILIIMSGFAFYTLTVKVTDDYRETLGTMDQLDLKRKQEKIEFVSVSTTTDDKLNVTVKNTGSYQARLIWLGVFDETLNTQEYHELDISINLAETMTNIGSSEPSVTITEGNKYVIQLVTELGNIVEYKFYPASEVRCELILMALPPTVYKGDNITVLLIVTHNDTEVDAIQSLTVSLEAEPRALVELKEEPASLSVEGMRRGESAFFKWIYNTVDTGTVTFNATYDQAPTGTYVLSTVEITEAIEESPPPVQFFGVFSLDWFYFSYTSMQHPEPISAGSIGKEEDYVAFYVRVTNNYNETITIQSPSMLMLLVAYQESLYYIVKDVNYPSAYWETDWVYTTSQKHTGSYSIQADEYSNYLTSIDLDASDATSVTVSFWYRDRYIDDDDNVYLQFWDGSTYDNIFELGNTSPENTWHYYTVTTSDPQYLISNFKIRFDGRSIDYGEYLWIDDVLITKISGEGQVTLLSDGFEYTSPLITAYDDANPITVGPHETQALIFAAESAGVDDWAWEYEMPYWYISGTEGAIAMIAIVFKIGDSPDLEAQSLPFRALVLYV